MSHQEYIANLDIDQLACLIEMSRAKISATKAEKKVQVFVVSDDWLNYGFYQISDPEAALSKFVEEYREQTVKGTFEYLEIRAKKFYPDEIKDCLVITKEQE